MKFKVLSIEHVAITVEDTKEPSKVFGGLLGITNTSKEEITAQKVITFPAETCSPSCWILLQDLVFHETVPETSQWPHHKYDITSKLHYGQLPFQKMARFSAVTYFVYHFLDKTKPLRARWIGDPNFYGPKHGIARPMLIFIDPALACHKQRRFLWLGNYYVTNIRLFYIIV